MSAGFTLFDTAIGRCALAWGAAGIVGVWLPEAGDEALHRRIARRHPDFEAAEPPAYVAEAARAIAAHLSGALDDLTAVTLDLSRVSELHRRVFAVARAIPPGRTLTYGEVAARIGEPGAARAVGKALGENPFPIVVPCHRVLAAGGRLHGFSAPGGLATKRRLLEIEKARAGDEPDLFDGV
jgi:methylated-DNA-[protein]-cysteine S-methyltransferase